MKTIEEIKKALNTIKEVCQSQCSSCTSCPMCYNNTCGITGNSIYGNVDYKKQPRFWNIPYQIKLMSSVED